LTKDKFLSYLSDNLFNQAYNRANSQSPKPSLMKAFCFSACAILSLQSFCQSPDLQKVRSWRTQHESTLVSEFTTFLAIPNVATDSPDIARNAAFIQQLMRNRHISNVQLLYGRGPGHPPAVYGEVLVPGAKLTIGFYAHYDGQPVNPAQWAPGLSPFTPVLFDGPLSQGGKPIPFSSGTNAQYQPEWRIYGRGASDDKAGVYAILSAYEALTANGMTPACNIRFLFEGEEEVGSIHLGDIFQAHAGLLGTDCWVICDGPVHQTGKKQIVFGVRGDTRLDLTVYGAKRPLHSGHYGNWAPNPALSLARLLASMKDDSGRVTIKAFYDDVQPLSAVEQKALADAPSVDGQMKEELGIQTTEMKGKNLSEAINLPSLNINGMQSGNVGAQASNQIPTYATAQLDLRLVLGNDWQRQQQKVIDHIRRQGFTVLDHDPTDAERREYPRIIKVLSGTGSYNAQRTSMALPIVTRIRSALQSSTPDQVVLQPTSGGSLPLYLFERDLHAHTVTVPIANHDNNQHAENENIRLANLWSGIESMAAIMRISS
jgi:acetylornithine deacetylase/succinyl-diaminopimelate desuccinylase-like protein